MNCKIAFYKGLTAPHRDWTDWVICKWTRGPYSHVELVIDGFMYSSSPRDGSVRRKPHKVDNTTWDYVDVDINQKNVLEFYNMTDGDKYDWAGILGFIIPIKDRTHNWFCSEWVSNALKIAGYSPLWPKEPSKISPNKLFKLLSGQK